MGVLPIPIPALPPAVEAVAAATGLPGEPLPGEALSVKQRLDGAARAIAAGRTSDAGSALADIEAARPSMTPEEASQLDFLQGMLAMELHDYGAAIRRFRRLLARDPRSVRARLEIGRAYFLKGDYANAERQFLFARAARLPPMVRRNIDNFLAEIRARKRFTLNFALSLASDSNRNAGPSVDAVTLYGLPFALSPSARANGGLGLAADLAADWAAPLTRRLKWRLGGQLRRAQYRDTSLDDMTLWLSTGPHYTLEHWTFDIAANVGRRWFGDRTFGNTYGASFGVTRLVGSRLGVEGTLGISRQLYVRNRLMDGTAASAGASLLYAPGPDTMIRAGVGLTGQTAAIPAYAFRTRQIGASYLREFGDGITLSLSANYARTRFDAPLAAFGVRRVEDQPSAQIMLLDRRIAWRGLTPRLSYAYAVNHSSIPLYRFRRGRFELSFTRTF